MYSFDSRWSLVPAAGLLLGLASCVNLTGGNGDTMTVASSGHGARLEFETWDGKSEAASGVRVVQRCPGQALDAREHRGNLSRGMERIL